MSEQANPCLSIAVDRLHQSGSGNFAIWILEAPHPGAKAHHDRAWSKALTNKWLQWQEMFSLQAVSHLPIEADIHQTLPDLLPELEKSLSSPQNSYGGRLMQDLGISLWRWLFDSSIQNSLAQSQGIAIGQNKPLRLRLEIRDPNLIPLPWEIMQPEAGKPAISLNQQLLFSRTTSDVERLSGPIARESLNILLVLGYNPQKHGECVEMGESQTPNSSVYLQLEQEAEELTKVIDKFSQAERNLNNLIYSAPAQVERLVQPTPAQLIDTLESGTYNILFYAGHGIQAPDGGLIFLRPDATINGTELAQVLVRTKVTLAVFNACLGAQPDQIGQRTIERSSLAEVLIHHGVPAVLAMRDAIADPEALSFMRALSESLSQGMTIDQAVAVARQQLLTLYKFNQPAWTLPILYMHPEFDGQLIKPIQLFEDSITELPTTPPGSLGNVPPVAAIRSLDNLDQVWQVRGGIMRVGRSRDNDLVIKERWVSQKHAEIIYRENLSESESESNYFLRDFSRYGTLICSNNEWQKIHHREVALDSTMQLKFGSVHGQTLEFVIDYPHW